MPHLIRPRPRLTGTRTKILRFITRYQASHGWPPTVREIMAALDFKSSGAIYEQLRKLERAGHLHLDPGTTRNIRLKNPPPVTPAQPLPLYSAELHRTIRDFVAAELCELRCPTLEDLVDRFGERAYHAAQRAQTEVLGYVSIRRTPS